MPITASTIIKTKFGDFKVCFHETKCDACVSFSQSDLTKGEPTVRIHSACLFGEVFHSLHCDCLHQITQTMALIQKNKCGVIVYSYQEGRGIGLKRKIEAMEIQRVENCDTVEAFKKLGVEKSDPRDFKAEVQALKDLGVAKEIQSFSGNPIKDAALKAAGFRVVKNLKIDDKDLSEMAKEEIKIKIKKMGYKY